MAFSFKMSKVFEICTKYIHVASIQCWAIEKISTRRLEEYSESLKLAPKHALTSNKAMFRSTKLQLRIEILILSLRWMMKNIRLFKSVNLKGLL